MILRFIGKSFIALGVLILLFLGYELWGTSLITKQEQTVLRGDLQRVWAAQPQTPERPSLGSGVAILRIPKIQAEHVVVEGVELADLKKGPGHYPGTPMPGQLGNAVISGHRTTYGAPFYRLDELKRGDRIIATTAEGTFTYRVTESKVVAPTDVAVIDNTQDVRLTLTTCHPRFSAKERLIIVAELDVKKDRVA